MKLLEITFKTKKLEKECESFGAAQKNFGHNIAVKLYNRFQQIRAAEDVEQLIAGKIGRCHSLDGDLSGCYAMDLGNPTRLIFSVKEGNIQIVVIEDVRDYH